MITVDNKFYESGCTMSGKGNRVFLKESDGRVSLEMVFLGNKVEINGSRGFLTPQIHDFSDIGIISAIKIEEVSRPVIELDCC